MSQPDGSKVLCAALSASLLLFAASVAHAATPTKGKVYRCGNVFQDLPCADAKVADPHPVVAATTQRDPATCIAAAKAAGKSDTSDCPAKPARESSTATQTK